MLAEDGLARTRKSTSLRSSMWPLCCWSFS